MSESEPGGRFGRLKVVVGRAFPRDQDNAAGIKATKQVLSMLKDLIFPDTPELL